MHAVQRNRQGFSKPERATQQHCSVEAQKGHRDIAAQGSIHHKPSETSHEEGNNDIIAPLTRGNPDPVAQPDHAYEPKICWIEEMLASNTEDKFAQNGNGSTGSRKPEGIRAQ